jgi:hypothetical protein
MEHLHCIFFATLWMQINDSARRRMPARTCSRQTPGFRFRPADAKRPHHMQSCIRRLCLTRDADPERLLEAVLTELQRLRTSTSDTAPKTSGRRFFCQVQQKHLCLCCPCLPAG